MIKSTFLSIGFHVFFMLIAYHGLPSFKAEQVVDLPIDIIEDTPVSSKTFLKLGNKNKKKVKKIADKVEKKINKKNIVPPPPPKPKVVEKKKEEINKTKKIAQLIQKKPVLKIKKKKNVQPPKIKKKPKSINQKQNSQLAKGILNTLTKSKPILEKTKNKKNMQSLKSKIFEAVGNSNKRVAMTSVELTQTDIDKIKNHIGNCWNTSIGASEVKSIIPLKISANTSGIINSVEIVESSLYAKDTFYRATADSARRAVLDCSPLPIPKNKVELFKSFHFDFDTSFINDN